MNRRLHRWLQGQEKKIARRLARAQGGRKPRGDGRAPEFRSGRVHYEVSERVQAMPYGGLGVVHDWVHEVGLVKALDERLGILKQHRPYFDSDHVLNLAYNALCGGRVLDDLEVRLAAKSGQFANVDTARDDTCIIAFTSGTTGQPKGTMHFHRDVMAICDCFPRSTLRAEASDVFCGTPPLGFTFGLGGLLLFPLRVGASTVLMERLTPPELLTTVQAYRATVMFTAPTFYRMMSAEVGKYDLSSLRKCVSAGEVLPAATRALWQEATGIRIIDGIGSTEMLHIFSSADEEHARPGATGKPVPGYEARVVDDHGSPLPAGQVGRLAVKGPTGCRYLADPRQANYVQDGWNITGDAYLVDADGYFVYQARTDDMIITAGYNIGGPEVEDALLRHPAVAEAAVVGVADEARGQVVKAYVVLKPGAPADAAMAEALQEFVKQQIAPYKYPRQVEFRTSLPRTETGKLQRFRLREEN